MTPKKIAVNTRLLLPNKLEGIGWYTFEVLKRWVASHPDVQFYFLFDRQWDEQFIFGKNVTPVKLSPQARHPVLFKIWFNYSITKWLKKNPVDVFVSTDGFVSLKTDTPQIGVIHDLNFEHRPQDLSPNIVKFYKTMMPKYANKATRLATVSEFSKQDIITQYNIPPDKITVTYNGASNAFQPISEENKETVKKRYTSGEDYFVYVGSLHARKNIKNMLLAFDQFKSETDSDLKFVIVGEKLWSNDDSIQFLNHLKFKEDIVFAGRLGNKELPHVVASAKAMVYVSFFEGFGIPIVEAMQCGVPVITSNITSMPEVAYNAALLTDPNKPENIAIAMQDVLNPETAKKLINKGLERAKDFSWDKTAKELWEVIESL